MKFAPGLFFAIALSAATPAIAARGPSADPAAFVQLYVRQLARMDALRPRGDIKRDPLAACGGHNKDITAALGTQIAVVQGFAFGTPFESLVPNLVKTYQRKLTLTGQLQTACAARSAGAVKDALSNLDYANRNIVNATPVVFAVLMDTRGGAGGGASRQLAISRAQREKLLRQVNAAFGKQIAAQDPEWTVTAAAILRDALANPQFKASDAR